MATKTETAPGAGGPGRGGRMLRRRKRDAVLRLLRGEGLETVSRSLGVTAATPTDLCGRPREAKPTYVDGHEKPSRLCPHASTKRQEPSNPEVCARRLRAVVRCAVRRRRIRAGHLAGIRSSVVFGDRRSASGKDPVRCALMSGLSCGVCRRPSWVCACVPGTILGGVLEAQHLPRYGLDCLD